MNGYDNEFEFVKYLNNKKVYELNPMFRNFIDNIFYDINGADIIKSWKNHYPQKADIFIKIGNIIKGISIKKGIRNSVHVEPITEFIHFLIENNVEKKHIIEYLKYQYADGTTNGSGKKRMSASEYKMNNQNKIEAINKVFNEKNIYNKAIERFILKGNNCDYNIDAIIYGEVNDFIWLTTNDIKRICIKKRNLESTAVHFGPLTCQPKDRCLNYNKVHEKDRYCVQLKWYNIHDDIIEMMNDNYKMRHTQKFCF